MSEPHECAAILACGLPCLEFAEFECREQSGPVCLKHSHPRSCCHQTYWGEELDEYSDVFDFACEFVVENPEAVGDPNATPRVRLVTHRLGGAA